MFIKLCSIRDIYKAIGEFEQQFHKQHRMHFHEAMIMCILSEESLATEELMAKSGIVKQIVYQALQFLEEEKLIEKMHGDNDQNISYKLTDSGNEKIEVIKTEELPLSEMLERLILVANIFEK